MPALKQIRNEVEPEKSVKDQVNHIEQEARMVVPGIQALFGFQLIAVFNQSFRSILSHNEQVLHLIAVFTVTIAVALVMAPAAYHRQAEPRQNSTYFANFSQRLLTLAMLPLAMGICIDFYIISRVIINSAWISFIISGALFLFFFTLWFVFPQIRSSRSV